MLEEGEPIHSLSPELVPITEMRFSVGEDGEGYRVSPDLIEPVMSGVECSMPERGKSWVPAGVFRERLVKFKSKLSPVDMTYFVASMLEKVAAKAVSAGRDVMVTAA